MDIRAINAFQQILDDPRSRPEDLIQVILNSNLVNLLATKQKEEQDETTRRWNEEFGLREEQFGLQKEMNERAASASEANLRMMEERIKQIQQQLQMGQEQFAENQKTSQFNRAMSMLNTGLQYPNTGLASPDATKHISDLLGYPLPSNYASGIPSNTYTGGNVPSLMTAPYSAGLSTPGYSLNTKGIPTRNVTGARVVQNQKNYDPFPELQPIGRSGPTYAQRQASRTQDWFGG